MTNIRVLSQAACLCLALLQSALIFGQGQTTQTSAAEPTLSDRDAYRAWLIAIHNDGMEDEFLGKSPAFIAADPMATGTAQLLYRQMRSMRRKQQWPEARAKANEIVAYYPDSEVAKTMGGAGGRTEDQAALDFAQITSYYQAKQFVPAISACEDFLKNYPKNWRTHDVYVTYCHALYHTGQREKFFEVGEAAISKKLVKNEGQAIQFLQAATYIKTGKYEQARQLLDKLEKAGPKSPLRPEFAKLRFDSYYYENRYDDLVSAADAYAATKTTGTKEWATGKMWSAVGRVHKNPPDLEGAAVSLDTIIDTNIADQNAADHVPTNALYWRVWVAQQQGDMDRARQTVKKIRDKMPAGPARDRALTKFSSLLNPSQE